MTATELLSRLRRRLGIADDSQDDLLMDLLADANAMILTYIRRDLLPAALYPAQCQLAVILYNRIGTEGESSRTEGGVTRVMSPCLRSCLPSSMPSARQAP